MFGRALLILVGVLALPGMGWAQPTDYSAGKSPAQLFAGDCSSCHKSPRGLAKGQDSRSLSDFLREHYTTRPENASALAAYLVGNPGSAVEPRQVESHGRKPRAATANAPAPTAEPEKPKPAEELSPFERLFGRVPSEPEKSTPVIAAPEEGTKPAAEPESRAKPARAAKPDRKQKRKPSEAAAHPSAAPEAGKPDEKPAEAGKGEAGKSEANKEDAIKAGAAEAARAERLKAEAAKAKAEAARAEAAKEAASKAEAAKEATAKADAAKADAAKVEAAKSEAAKAEAAKLRSYATGGEEAKPVQSDAPAAQGGGEAK